MLHHLKISGSRSNERLGTRFRVKEYSGKLGYSGLDYDTASNRYVANRRKRKRADATPMH